MPGNGVPIRPAGKFNLPGLPRFESRFDRFESANGLLSSTPQKATADNQLFETCANRGAGCSQSPLNIVPVRPGKK